MLSDNSSKLVHIPADSAVLDGVLDVPREAQALVIFAHGSGSSRHSKRNKYVAQVLREAGLGTLLFDLLTREEDTFYEKRFDMPLLAERLIAATRWIKDQPQTRNLNIGYFGASTGAAAALLAATEPGIGVNAIVSRGGRPDLAEQALKHVKAPTLLIVGGYDDVVIQLNQQSYKLIKAEKELRIIPGATHLFEEPGTLEEVARFAAEWFKKHLTLFP
ncbi:MAG: dienelactone hydrolase family protein [Thermodesulfovibrionales bacterium]|nr:dienelactone hydrolase family protein [Thermodesulfovibrionales bacterium]